MWASVILAARNWAANIVFELPVVPAKRVVRLDGSPPFGNEAESGDSCFDLFDSHAMPPWMFCRNKLLSPARTKGGGYRTYRR